MLNKRIFVEKKLGFQVEKYDLYNDLKEKFNLTTDFRLFNLYDIYNVSEDEYNYSKKNVFAEVVVDDLYEKIILKDKCYIAFETLPAQFDQRADSADKCIKLFNPKSIAKVTCGKLLIFKDEIDETELLKLKKYLINPIEARLKDMSKLQLDLDFNITDLKDLTGFIDYNDEELNNFLIENSLAMSINDLKLVQKYFKIENREPIETEIKVLDTYWSDHCRHTTFETAIDNVSFSTEKYKNEIEIVFKRYLELRSECKRDNKPINLMDMATINSRYLRSINKCQNIEISDEINACSMFVDVDHDGDTEKWLVMFKNETHNHPTEIEPFGGAATCIGGAIRDPLSGRSYVYQAMRITGSKSILTPLNQTLENKLSQLTISKKSSDGNSSYGNQIGLATSFVKEIYHDSYQAKHLEVGAVVGATKAENVKRIQPVKGDVIILLGGKTGRDGIGGATGSSKQHTSCSLEKCVSEVQKGNAVEERKIQRLFSNPDCAQIIKKCNDFGAGGVCVAIGELADGLVINLDAIKTKYAGLNATEIAISESQERMAVVVDKSNVDKFIKLAQDENIDAYKVGLVTDDNRLVMNYKDNEVVNISREFIDSAGYRQHVDVDVNSEYQKDIVYNNKLTKENILNTLADVNVASQKGMEEKFDASIGAKSVLMPYGGKYQLTKTQASIMKVPVLDGRTNTCTALTYGFNPKLMENSCFTGAKYSLLDSMSKTIACGSNFDSMYFSFQEYFERLNKDPEKWGKVFESLLGTIDVQDFFQIPSIGGKDSMSGTFNDINVCPTLISFACSICDINNVITPEFKDINHKIVVYLPRIINGKPDLQSYKNIYDTLRTDIENKKIYSSYVVEDGGIITALFKMSLGNDIRFNINADTDLFKIIPGTIICEVDKKYKNNLIIELGSTTNDYSVNGIKFEKEEILNAHFGTFKHLYPTEKVSNDQEIKNISYTTDTKFKAKKLYDEVKVVIPVFPGTNCELDTKRAFEEVGAKVKLVIFNNLNDNFINESIDTLAKEIQSAQILAFPGGFSSGDEPDGSAKFIVNVLKNKKIKAAVDKLRENDGLIIGICNGFQALIKSGLLPYGEIKDLSENDPTLFKNDINRHISKIANTRVASNNSPWLNGLNVNETYSIAVSHGEGKFVCNDKMLKELTDNNQIVFQYCDLDGNATNDANVNINGSTYAIEGIISKDGRILGKMGHSERYTQGIYKNIIGNKYQNIFENGVNYFLKENR
jgi:phosphoribosylformylglycinamidine synthase